MGHLNDLNILLGLAGLDHVRWFARTFEIRESLQSNPAICMLVNGFYSRKLQRNVRPLPGEINSLPRGEPLLLREYYTTKPQAQWMFVERYFLILLHII
jgi:hypothetical protein